MAPPKGFKHSLEARKRISDALRVRVRTPHTEETKAKISESRKGITAWNKGVPMTWTPARSKGKEPWNKGLKGVQVSTRKGKRYPETSGEKHWAWKGGITPINRKIRGSIEYKNWRRAVFERDNYACVECNKQGGRLEADHIKQFAYFPELRFEVSNGRTLCKPCHQKTDTYSKRHA